MNKIAKPFKGEFPVTQGFGEAEEWYVKIAGYPHNGMDFAMPTGIPVLACDDGVLTYADNVPDSDGCGINIQHEWGMSQYWHLSALVAKYGEKVAKEQKIGLSGATGWATGPHLHFGIKINGQGLPNMRGWCDPNPYFEKLVTPEPPIQNTTRSHTVTRGETLWSIAIIYYKKGYLWSRIYEANKKIIKNPNLIYSGQKFLIP